MLRRGQGKDSHLTKGKRGTRVDLGRLHHHSGFQQRSPEAKKKKAGEKKTNVDECLIRERG